MGLEAKASDKRAWELANFATPPRMWAKWQTQPIPLGYGPVASSGYGLLVFLSVAVTVRVIVGEPPMPVTVKT